MLKKADVKFKARSKKPKLLKIVQSRGPTAVHTDSVLLPTFMTGASAFLCVAAEELLRLVWTRGKNHDNSGRSGCFRLSLRHSEQPRCSKHTNYLLFLTRASNMIDNNTASLSRLTDKKKIKNPKSKFLQRFNRAQLGLSSICILLLLTLAGAASSVDVWHTLEPLGHAAVTLGCSFTCVGAQEPVHVVTVLANAVFNASDVQPADDHPEELQREGGREG